ncbi:MAG: endonuclease domain-containing protein [Pseudonocardia sp.]
MLFGGRRDSPGVPFDESATATAAIGDPGRVLDAAFRGSDAVRAGVLTKAQLRGSRFRRVFPDVYVPSALGLDLGLRSHAAYLLFGGRGVLAGYSAAELLQAACAPAETPAEVIVCGEHVRKHPGVIVHSDRLGPEDVRQMPTGVAVTTPVRTAYDLVRWRDLVEGVVAVDALAGRFGFRPSAVLDVRDRHPRARGHGRLAQAVELAEPMAESPMETRLRMVLVLRGLPRPTVQHPVPDERARTVAVLDLAYPAARIGIEYEGEDHWTRDGTIRDARRYTRLTDLGWRIYRFIAADVYRRPDATADQIRRALALARP